jgi:two-component system NtrC family sensor kinase
MLMTKTKTLTNKRIDLRARLRRFHHTVRFRLLVLTSAPILLTIVGLIGATLYWSIQYTWQNTLQDVSERLRVAQSSVSYLLSEQELKLIAIANSHHLYQLLQVTQDAETINRWLSQYQAHAEFDFILYYPKSLAIASGLTEQLGSHFSVIEAQALAQLSPGLAKKAKLDITDTRTTETKALVTRSLVPIYKGEHQLVGYLDAGIVLNHQTQLVDKIRDLVYPSRHDNTRPHGAITFFLDNLRVSTNVALNSEENVAQRAVGTLVSADVYRHVIQGDKEWVNLAFVVDRWYVSAYQPIYNAKNTIIGMLYTGYPMWPILKAYLINILEIAIFSILLLMLSGITVYRSSRGLFRPIERIANVVNAVQAGQSSRIGEIGLNEGNELTQLAAQFDRMLDILDSQQNEMIMIAKSLEHQVDQRTISLHEKNKLLEEHIKLLEQTRNQLIAQEKFAALGELTAGIAHEINNPIAVILGNTQLINQGLKLGNHEFDEELESITKQINRIKDIIRSLLQYSHNTDHQHNQNVLQSVNPIIEESITLVRTGDNKHNIHFACVLNAQCQVPVNRHQLLQVLVNLIVNAIQAMLGKGEVTIQSHDWRDEERILGVIIEICDHGYGIPDDKLPQIFEPFYTTKQEGTGLGLSVSQNLIHQMGGEIRVETAPSKTCFSLYLPSRN